MKVTYYIHNVSSHSSTHWVCKGGSKKHLGSQILSEIILMGASSTSQPFLTNLHESITSNHICYTNIYFYYNNR